MARWEKIVTRTLIDSDKGDSFIRTKPFSTWSAVKELLNKFDANWIFRGQQDASWGLQTSLERWAIKEKLTDLELREQLLAEEFEKGARNFFSSSVRVPQNTLEWLSLMQHHGCPTRLLDFTISPYVASFFAIEECHKDECAIWCIERDWCKKTAVANYNKEHDKKEHITEIQDFAEEKIFKGLFWEDPKAVQMIFPVNPLHNNERIEIQQGLFLCQGSNETFSENVEAMENHLEYILKIIISSKVHKEAIADLNKMNINNATLFPGLDGYAKSIKNRFLF